MSDEIYDTLIQYIQNEQLLGNVAELDDMLCDLVDSNCNDPYALKSLLQCIYRLLLQHNKWEVKFGHKVFHRLINLLAHIKNRQLIANILICVQLCVRKFPKEDGKFLIEKLWSLSLNIEEQPHAAQILVQLFDDIERYKPKFTQSKELMAVIRQLLVSELREERKSAYFILRKLISANFDEVVLSQWGWTDTAQFTRAWTIYTAILENIDENNYDQLFPLLEKLSSIQNSHPDWQDWLNLLYSRLLGQTNFFVLCGILEHIFTNFKCKDLNSNILCLVLQATNRLDLHNVEGYHLPQKFVRHFLENADFGQFFSSFTTISWLSVPLHYWIYELKRVPNLKKQDLQISTALLNRLAACVRNLQNAKIRYDVDRLIYELFDCSINKLKLDEYIEFVENLHDVTDPYYDHKRFLSKLHASEDIAKDTSKMSKSFYVIFTNLYRNISCLLPGVEHFSGKVHLELVKKLSTIPKEQHSWWRFLLIFDAGQESRILEFCQKAYDLDLKALSVIDSLSELEQIFSKVLPYETEEQKSLVHKKTVDFFIENRVHHWHELKDLHLDAQEILAVCSETAFLKLCELLSAHDARISNEILVALVDGLKKYLRFEDLLQSASWFILQYAKSQMVNTEVEQLVLDLLNINHNEIVSAVTDVIPISKEVRIRGILIDGPAPGDERIEAAYEELILNTVPNVIKMRKSYHHCSAEESTEIFDELLRLNNELTLKVPIYNEHSREHRLKIRMVYAMLNIQYEHDLKHWSDDLWTAVFASYNQININYLYEMLIIRCVPKFDTIMAKLRQIAEYTPNQQNSLISIVYNYCMQKWKNWETATLVEIIQILLPLTMGANFQTRLLAQIVIYDLITESEKHEIDIPIGTIVKTAIEQTLGDKLTDYMSKELRLRFPQFHKKCGEMCSPDLILHITNAPFEEAAHWCLRYSFDYDFQQEIDALKGAFKNKSFKQTTTEEKYLPDSAVNQAAVSEQGKLLNERNDIASSDLDFNLETKNTKNEIFVVASLLDKLPNLGGIARSCEVLGIKNLIITSKKLMENDDFKNISLTAEKNLNITEVKKVDLAGFLIQKQREGFKIVGAEQTRNSVSFVDFKFPAKCLLLLGHEKHGIPADLLGFLDYAVEIPQFGEVRSLNVHVTGALFMWEYCKQYKVKSLENST